MSLSSYEDVSPQERDKISHLLGFAGELLLARSDVQMEMTLVSERDHDASKALIGVHTPLGEALLNKEVGETAEFTAGAYVKEVRIIDFL